MKYNGKIKNINHIVVSDPSYEKCVWCRYERNNLKEKNWFVELEINDIDEEIGGIDISGIEFRLLLQPNKSNCKMIYNGIEYSEGIKVDKFDIGMDPACVALGINDYAKEINESDEWQPKCAIRTLTDGMFGEVMEGKKNNKLSLIFITGYLSDDTSYSKEDLLYYLTEQFQIEDLEKNNDKEQEVNKEL